MRDHALALASRGFHVFPLAPGSKKPQIPGVDWKTLATTDADAIEQLWRDHPDANIGIHTGVFGDGGQALLVVDIDNKNGKHGDSEFRRLIDQGVVFPVTLEQVTPSGGRHLIYVTDTPVRSGTDLLGPGLDVKSGGGYIVGPGSRTPSGTYAWVGEDRPLAPADPSLVSRCGQAKPRDPNARIPLIDEDQPRHVDWAIAFLKEEAPARQGQGGDEHTLSVARQLRGHAISQDLCLQLMLTYWNPRCEPPWDPEELATKVDNAYRYARERPGADTAEADFGGKPQAQTPRHREPSYGITRLSAAAPDLKRTWLVKNWLLPGQMSVLVGHSNVGKTFIALDLLMAVARGRPWFGCRTKPKAVVYVAAEGAASVTLRLHAYRLHHGIEDAEWEAIPFGLLAAPVNLRDPAADTGQLIHMLNAFAEAVRLPLGLVVIDTLARAMAGGNENAAEDMGAYIRNSDRIREETGAHVMHIHHLGKDAAKGARGSSALKAGTDTEIVVTRDEDGGTLYASKQRDVEGGSQGGFRLKPIKLGVDEDDDPVNSCVVVEQSPAGDDFKKPRLKGREKVAMEVLSKLEMEEGGEPPTEWQLPPDSLVVSEARWREVCAPRLTSASPEAQSKAFGRVRDKLREKGYVGMNGECVWINP